MHGALQPLCELAAQAAAAADAGFMGVDPSICPSLAPEASLARAFEQLGVGAFGEAGTLAVCAMVTRAVKSLAAGQEGAAPRAGLPLVGYAGLMLPPLEDAGLAQCVMERRLDVPKLLMYSSVCGIGIDCVPIAGAQGRSRCNRACSCARGHAAAHRRHARCAHHSAAPGRERAGTPLAQAAVVQAVPGCGGAGWRHDCLPQPVLVQHPCHASVIWRRVAVFTRMTPRARPRLALRTGRLPPRAAPHGPRGRLAHAHAQSAFPSALRVCQAAASGAIACGACTAARTAAFRHVWVRFVGIGQDQVAAVINALHGTAWHSMARHSTSNTPCNAMLVQPRACNEPVTSRPSEIWTRTLERSSPRSAAC